MSNLLIVHEHSVTAIIPAEFWSGVLAELCGMHEVRGADQANALMFVTDTGKVTREFLLQMYARPDIPAFRQIIGMVAKELPLKVPSKIIFQCASPEDAKLEDEAQPETE